MQPRSAQEGRPWGAAATPYEEIGGETAIRELADAFYDRVETEAPSLRVMLPRDTSTSRTKLYEFLSGWMGGPQLYVEKRGHPRLRMRHLPFSIGDHEAAEWMRCMELAMDDVGIDGSLRSFLSERLEMSALHLRNR